ncbi:MAG TPA: nitrate- and nitrite sensing domain-containing protein [Actinomycetes bacterium]|nr:nitrate- and nitrite sensing domain-containing protein [Actinomycetes bacterium]
MLQNLRIRSKLVAIFLLPALTLAVIAAGRIQSSVQNGLRADRDRRMLSFVNEIAGFNGELQTERTLSLQFVASGRKQGGDQLSAQRVRVDRALATLQRSQQRITGEISDERTRQTLQRAKEKVDQLVSQRRNVDNGLLTGSDSQAFYSEAIDRQLTASSSLVAQASDADVLRAASTYVATSHIKEAAAREHDIGLESIQAGRFVSGGSERLTTTISTELAWVKRFQATATDRQWTTLATKISAPDAAESGRLRQALIAEGRAGAITIDPAAWNKASQARLAALSANEQGLFNDVLAANRTVAQNLEQSLMNDVLLVLVFVALAVAFAMTMARSMVRPLAALRDAAHEVAERRLPGIVDRLQRSERIDPKAEALQFGVKSRDEIGEVSDAFKTAHEVAVQVATEQAALRKSIGDMFLNLARRSQSLIDRQIELIDELERKENDPDALQELFQLDHLATRLRRNAEDLIVLSGAKPARRWSRPVPLYDVIRAATAEVEDYTRIEVLPIEDLGVSGQAVADIIHLLAELVENATSFSPPGTKVHIAGQSVAGGYMIEIEDRGVGMANDELVEINERLSNPPVIDLTLSRRLGLFVVGRLASRYGIKVQLRHSWYGGVTALVLLPDSLLVRSAGVAGVEGRPDGESRGGLVLAPRPGQKLEETPPLAPGQSGWFDASGSVRPYIPLRRHATFPSGNAPAARAVPAPPADRAAPREWPGGELPPVDVPQGPPVVDMPPPGVDVPQGPPLVDMPPPAPPEPFVEEPPPAPPLVEEPVPGPDEPPSRVDVPPAAPPPPWAEEPAAASAAPQVDIPPAGPPPWMREPPAAPGEAEPPAAAPPPAAREPAGPRPARPAAEAPGRLPRRERRTSPPAAPAAAGPPPAAAPPAATSPPAAAEAGGRGQAEPSQPAASRPAARAEPPRPVPTTAAGLPRRERRNLTGPLTPDPPRTSDVFGPSGQSEAPPGYPGGIPPAAAGPQAPAPPRPRRPASSPSAPIPPRVPRTTTPPAAAAPPAAAPPARPRPPSAVSRQGPLPATAPPASAPRPFPEPERGPREPAAPRSAAPPEDATTPLTRVGLPRRIPRANLAPAWVAGPGAPAPRGASNRSPEEVRSMLSSYRTGLERGRHESSGEEEPESGQGARERGDGPVP